MGYPVPSSPTAAPSSPLFDTNSDSRAFCSKALAESGASVVVADLNEEKAGETAASLVADGHSAIGVKVDITVHRFSDTAREKITAAGGSATQL